MRPAGAPRTNARDLVVVTVSGQVAHPVGRSSPYRVGHDGVPRVLPGSGGIAVNQRIGDRCVGLAGDHIEPGAALHNNGREIVGPRNGPNLALMSYCCAGNAARVASGPVRNARGLVTGKHGGVDHVIVDFPTRVLQRLQIGDQVQIWTVGQGMTLLDHPDIAVLNCSPRLLRRWGVRSEPPLLTAPVTHIVPAAVMGSGIGRPDAARGDYDIQLFDPEARRRYRLDTLRFGDIVAIQHSDTRLGRAYRRGAVTIAVIVHGDSTISGHGPGAMTLLTTTERSIRPLIDVGANLAQILNVRPLSPPVRHRPLASGRARPGTRHVAAPSPAQAHPYNGNGHSGRNRGGSR